MITKKTLSPANWIDDPREIRITTSKNRATIRDPRGPKIEIRFCRPENSGRPRRDKANRPGWTITADGQKMEISVYWLQGPILGEMLAKHNDIERSAQMDPYVMDIMECAARAVWQVVCNIY